MILLLTPEQSLAIMESQRAVVVLSRGRETTPEIRDMQNQLAHLSRRTTHLVAENSGPQIQMEDPGLVAGAILRLIGK